MTMHVTIRSDVHDNVIRVEPAAETTQQLVAARAGAKRDVDYFVSLSRSPGTGESIEIVERQVGNGVEQRGGDLGMHVCRPQQVDRIDCRWRDGYVGVGPSPQIPGG